MIQYRAALISYSALMLVWFSYHFHDLLKMLKYQSAAAPRVPSPCGAPVLQVFDAVLIQTHYTAVYYACCSSVPAQTKRQPWRHAGLPILRLCVRSKTKQARQNVSINDDYYTFSFRMAKGNNMESTAAP